jgi:hypothetical protein
MHSRRSPDLRLGAEEALLNADRRACHTPITRPDIGTGGGLTLAHSVGSLGDRSSLESSGPGASFSSP